VGCKVDGKGQIWSNDGKVIGKAGVIAGGEKSADGPFSGFEVTSVQKDGTVVNGSGDIIGRITEGEVTKLVGRKVDDDGGKHIHHYYVHTHLLTNQCRHQRQERQCDRPR
jgi:hypothetical protein